MWSQEGERKVKIPPNVLKNFNVFGILEPQKNGAKNSDGTNVAKLIDIDDSSCDSGFSEVSASFLNNKKNYDLVDLYQDIFVNPQLIENKVTDNEAAGCSKKTFEDDEEFARFLDMLESGKKIDFSTISETKKEANSKRYLHELTEKPKVLIPKVVLPKNRSDCDSDPEDLIHEVLMQKKFEEYVRKKCSPTKTVNEVDQQQSSSSKTVSGVSSKVSCTTKIANHESFNERVYHSKSTGINMKEPVAPSYSHKIPNNNLCNEKIIENNYEYSSNSKSIPIDNQISNSLYNFKLIAMKKDEKIYKKNRVIRPESQTSKYTKGPDFYEKSVVLPQILARMTARQAYLDQQENLTRRLVLDGGVKTSVIDSSITNNAKEQKSQVKSSAYPATSVKTNSNLPSNPMENDEPIPSTSAKPDHVKITKDTRLCMNWDTQNIAIHDTEKQCSNCNKKSNKSGKPNDDYGKLNPTVLMEDCNKERLKDWMLSQKFKNFVQNGEF